MRSLARPLLALAFALAGSGASAQIYQCPNATGQKVFQQAPCTGGIQIQQKVPPPIGDPDDEGDRDLDDVGGRDRSDERAYPDIVYRYYRYEQRTTVVVQPQVTVVRPIVRPRPRPVPPEPVRPQPVRPAEMARLRP